MKKKIFFGVATMFFAVATMFNMNMVQGSSAADVSLENISVMARAQDELPPNYLEVFNLCDRSTGDRCNLGGGWYAVNFKNK